MIGDSGTLERLLFTHRLTLGQAYKPLLSFAQENHRMGITGFYRELSRPGGGKVGGIDHIGRTRIEKIRAVFGVKEGMF